MSQKVRNAPMSFVKARHVVLRHAVRPAARPGVLPRAAAAAGPAQASPRLQRRLVHSRVCFLHGVPCLQSVTSTQGRASRRSRPPRPRALLALYERHPELGLHDVSAAALQHGLGQPGLHGIQLRADTRPRRLWEGNALLLSALNIATLTS